MGSSDKNNLDNFQNTSNKNNDNNATDEIINSTYYEDALDLSFDPILIVSLHSFSSLSGNNEKLSNNNNNNRNYYNTEENNNDPTTTFKKILFMNSPLRKLLGYQKENNDYRETTGNHTNIIFHENKYHCKINLLTHQNIRILTV